MKKYGLLIIFLFIQIWIVKGVAQNNLEINKAFTAYGKQKGSTMVLLSKDILSKGNSRIETYKSLVTTESEQKK